MARRRDLNGIAAGILGSFVSRNNDVGGYWAIGVLRRQAEAIGLSRATLNLRSNDQAVPDTLVEMRRKYAKLLESQLAKRNMNMQWVKDAEITVVFGTSGDLPEPPLMTWGDPLVCTVSILDDRGRLHRVSAALRCAPHDPTRERKRADPGPA
jgi:hypothetical protein